EAQLTFARPVQRRHRRHADVRVPPQLAAGDLGDSSGGENESRPVLTATGLLRRRCATHTPLGGRGRVTPDGVEAGAPAEGLVAGCGAGVVGRAGVVAATVRRRATTRSVMSRFRSAATISDAFGSLLRMML